MNGIEFYRPGFLWLFLAIIPMIAWYVWKEKDSRPRYQVSSLKAFENAKSFRQQARHILFVLRLLTISMLILALARPKKVLQNTEKTTKGISIVMAIDISGSMEAKDFDPNRLEVAKKEAINFISGRPNDRIGIVAFAAESFTQCPLTTDHATAINLLRQLKTGIVEDGTAIGLGLANAVARLKNDNAKSKVIILLTDGVNNSGEVSPLSAADMAKALGIRVYTIGIGKNGYAPFPVQTPFGTQYQQMKVEIDENLLRKIADETGGKYFRATNESKLREIYSEIDKMEKTIFNKESSIEYKDYFMPFLWLAFAFLILEILLANTVFRTLP